MPHTFNTVDEMHTYAASLASELHGSDVLLLQGDLGSGKTTFAQGFAKALGINEPVRSPTFIIRQDFVVKNNPTIARLVHTDLYRLNESSDLSTIDLDEALADPHTVTLIEWPERASNYPWPGYTKRLSFEHGAEPGERIVNLTENGS